MDCSLPGSSVHGILQAGILEWEAFPFLGYLPDPEIKPRSPALQEDSLASESPGKPKYRLQLINNVVLFSGVPQGESVIHTHVSFL